MIQTGLNTGPRHCQVLGWAKSYTKKLTAADMVIQDLDIIGAAGILWRLHRSLLPTEITDEVDKRMKEIGMPTMATRHVEPGMFSQQRLLQSL
jgi:hypothetical protein